MSPTTPPDAKPRCCARIYFKHKACSRTGKVDRDGKWYCGTHDPVAIKKAAEDRHARYKAAHEERMREIRLQQAAPDLLEALEGITEYASVFLKDHSFGSPAHQRFVKACAAIAKAKGEQP